MHTKYTLLHFKYSIAGTQRKLLSALTTLILRFKHDNFQYDKSKNLAKTPSKMALGIKGGWVWKSSGSLHFSSTSPNVCLGINSMSIIESEMISHEQLILSSQGD